MLLGFLLWSLILCELVYPVVDVTEHVYKRKQSFDASYGCSKSFSHIVSVEVAGWEHGGHTLFQLVFIHSAFFGHHCWIYFVLSSFSCNCSLLHIVGIQMGLFVVGRAPIVCLAIPLFGIAQFAMRIGKWRALFVRFRCFGTLPGAGLELC